MARMILKDQNKGWGYNNKQRNRRGLNKRKRAVALLSASLVNKISPKGEEEGKTFLKIHKKI